ncbi:MAG TPA: T9SS type A sorting domain-containing protein, partial [Rhodothermales bacterium]|nr:T9SS type A sorting domain-containing protein [Rhodothermales bacterium]
TIANGDRILVTAARVVEFSGQTQLDNIVFSVQSAGAPLGFKVLPTGLLNGSDPAVLEQHEAMMLQFNNVTITDVNADGADDVFGFGEWQFSSDGTEANEIRGDDFSDAIPEDFNITNFVIGQQRLFIRGTLRFANSQYKVVPVVLGDIGDIGVANEPVAPAAGQTGIQYTYPNPTTGAARVRYTVAAAGAVRLAVYDALGREVAVLVEGQLAPSTYEADFDGARLAPGLYVVRLQAGGAVHTARLTVAH